MQISSAQVGKDMLDFLDTHIPETSEDFELYDQQMDSYMTHLERLLRDEERQVCARVPCLCAPLCSELPVCCLLPAEVKKHCQR